MFNPGQSVSIKGKVFVIQSRFASGKHYQYTMSDGSVFIDLHLDNAVKLVQEQKWPKGLPKEFEDHEE